MDAKRGIPSHSVTSLFSFSASLVLCREQEESGTKSSCWFFSLVPSSRLKVCMGMYALFSSPSFSPHRIPSLLYLIQRHESEGSSKDLKTRARFLKKLRRHADYSEERESDTRLFHFCLCFCLRHESRNSRCSVKERRNPNKRVHSLVLLRNLGKEDTRPHLSGSRASSRT